MSRNYFIFDENKCVGCEACVVACVLENGFQFPDRWRTIYSSNKNKIPGLPFFNLSLGCNHCEDAPCMNLCPSLSFSRDTVTGAILIDSEKCIGCKYCTWNCPYEAPKYNPVSRVIEKCNFCNSRLLEKKKPSCAVSCPTGALDFSFDEIDKATMPNGMKTPNNPSPSIEIIKLKRSNAPIVDLVLFKSLPKDISEKTDRLNISAITELPLLIFTLVVALVVPISASNLLQHQSIGTRISFVLIIGMAAAISTIHLGQKHKFWRSVLNFRRSWLSREIVFFSIYFTLSIVDAFIYRMPTFVIVLFGLATLLSVDMLYKPLQWNWKTQWHYGQVLLISTSFFLLINQFYIALLAVILLRILIIALTLSISKIEVMPIIWFLFMLKTGMLVIGGYDPWLVILVFVLGEITARISFYNKLSIFKLSLKSDFPNL